MRYDRDEPGGRPIAPARVGRLTEPDPDEAAAARRAWRMARDEFEGRRADPRMPPRNADPRGADPRPFDARPHDTRPLSFDPTEPPAPPPSPKRRRRWGRWFVRALAAAILLFFLAVAWLALTAPLSKSLEPPAPPSITLLSAEGTPIARRGAIIGKPVDAATLPDHVVEAFLAIEDRRFRSHWGVDPRGIARAAWSNLGAGGVRQGGSTITQQLAKNAFLDSDRTAARKLREALIAFWLEAWLTKDEILSRYLSNAYFGDNVYGLSAAATHYFSRDADELTVGQAAMLAGLVKAPSRLAPTGNLKGARARQSVVVGAMAAAGYLTEREADAVRPAVLRVRKARQLPSGTYFADWVLPAARDKAGGITADQRVTTTLEDRMQRAAERAIRGAGLRQTQAAMVVMRPDGRIIAMVGGRNYAASPFNRATQARRQPGSTFKLFVYLAALRSGLDPDSPVLDEPVTIGEWSPKNSDGRYRGTISLREAFARSSNVAAARLTTEVGVDNVIRAARDLGISTPIAREASIALGTSGVSLLELTAAYAAIAAGERPVIARGLTEEDEPSWFERLRSNRSALSRREVAGMRELLAASVDSGTGRSAALPVDTFGKTGTTQDNRDALFIGYADGIVAAVWLGNDDNTPNAGLAGGGLPARIWRNFMRDALDLRAPAPPPVAAPVEEADPLNEIDAAAEAAAAAAEAIDAAGEAIDREIDGIGLEVGPDGDIAITRGGRRPGDAPPPPPAEPRRGRDEE